MAFEVKEQVVCYHCGQVCEEQEFKNEDKIFCCYGCRTVYEILNENNLCEYYSYESTPGVSLKYVSEDTYTYLDDVSIKKKLLSFHSESFARVDLFVPAIHCISCIWLLENLQKLNKGIVKSEVNFSRKRVSIDYNPSKVALSEIARLIASLGYPPQINLSEEKKKDKISSKDLLMKLAVAGFGFGNIMLLSFPEYLGLEGTETTLKNLFSYLNIALAIPITFYSGKDYFANALQSFRQRQINIDVPIAVGLAALFFRSIYDILSHSGAGYLDSLAGLVFFLLIGRWFQSKTYESLAFDRDFRSYFPLAVQKKNGEEWNPIVIYDLEKGDTIRVRNWEVVPADSLLLDVEAYFDYSFVTGESKPVKVKARELVYAGGRLVGKPVSLVVEKKTSQSHLTSLWNKEIFQKTEESTYRKIIDLAARRFTWVVLAVALITATYWYWADASQMWLVLTSVLMVACPCALALAAPFTYGNMLRVFGRHGFYLKNADVIERLSKIDTVVFDKTGTVTNGAAQLDFIGVMDDRELAWVKTLTSSSSHPLSNLITKSIKGNSPSPVTDFFEKPGRGIEGNMGGHHIVVGSAEYVKFTGVLPEISSKVFVSIDDQVRGYFKIETSVREGIEELMQSLHTKKVAMLSGDSEADRDRMKKVFPATASLLFNQNPHDKLEYISSLQSASNKVMMLGDGLNDSGALKQSDVGVAITDDTGVFTPSCDGILEGNKLSHLNKFISLSRSATLILKTGFAISFFYNIIALSFAVSGHLTPLIAAILMPISSISVVGFSTLAVNLVANKTLRS
jgi:P-type Cu+ transporter